MIEYHWNTSLERRFICDACGRKIADPAEVRLLRDAGALPEEPPRYIHAHCLLLFTARRTGQWQPFLLSSQTAAWFI